VDVSTPGDLYLFTDGGFLKDKLIGGSGIVTMNHNFDIIYRSGTCYFPVFSSAHIEKLSMKEGKEKTALIHEFLSADILEAIDLEKGEYIHQWVPAHTGIQVNEALLVLGNAKM
jgi:ribonuclease HI